MSSDDVVIDVRNVSKCYEIYNSPRDRLKQLVFSPLRQTVDRILGRRSETKYYREFWALRDISFQVRRGETLGIIGRNGGGKSTLLQIIAGTLTPTHGDVQVTGRVAALLELGSGFNPEFTGRENVFLNGRILGLTQEEIEQRFDEIVEFADIGAFIDQPVKTYSSGMFVRLAFAVQAHIDAGIVIIDEALAVGDVFFRQKCYSRLEQLRKSGAAILLVSHSMAEVEQFCERAILLSGGKQIFNGSSVEATKHYYLTDQQTHRVMQDVDGMDTRVRHESEKEAGSDVPVEFPFPIPKAFLNLSGVSQVSNGKARCTALALCNTMGEPCGVFRQGDVAVFHYEFEFMEDIGIPICGVVISNERGVIVHGKNSWQYEEVVLPKLEPGRKLVCQHQVQLNLGPGDYSFEIGLTSLLPSYWENRSRISHDEFTGLHRRVCHIPNAGQFSIGLAVKDGLSVLTHHGVADLPGKITKALQ